ncbi:hypothetical protein SERLA73DRAFT_116277 [Serpula lacrymans var. lacrymans S7.3]|uniref:RFX-type winged-helix domain-containing protein n=1 Tax=Serpula lacrymans var. lacrymans (strain S7.3) TaxID=936435 RepID=F8QEY2_SERL3|nr:hypothetical protein SERLA73DRAFT_116277 [Serpula lacrymans var. lacrymans S7.3]
MATPFANAGRGAAPPATPYYRQYIPPQQTSHRVGPTVTDDYERWYTETNPSNRMLLSLRSGITLEIAWALDRLYRLCDNEQFVLTAIPGLADALFDWPEWYVARGNKDTEQFNLFSSSKDEDRKRRHALESLFILRNCSSNEPNAQELASHPRTMPLVLNALHNLDPDMDMNVEFVLHSIELLQAISSSLILPSATSPPHTDPLAPLQNITANSSNRSLIIAALVTINLLFSNPANLSRLNANSPALSASIRYLPLFVDKPLVEACLTYMYTHLSHPPMVKAFLLHPVMPSTVRLLVSLLVSEQIEEPVSVDISGSVYTVPALTVTTQDHNLTKEEMDTLLPMPEPQRCYEWMKTMFVAKPEGELTQVDFWNLYKDVFTPHHDRYPLLVASDVIKNVTVVFPQAQAMVLPGPAQRFIVRGVDRRKDTSTTKEFKCHWERDQCTAPPFDSPGEVYDHLLEHLSAYEGSELPCLWSSCPVPTMSKTLLRPHILTHLSTSQYSEKHPSQDDMITMTSDMYPYPSPDPTTRPPPPPRYTAVTYRRPMMDPPTTSLTALLCIRILFRASFVSSDPAPRVDADHFGFPGVVEDDDEPAEEDFTGPDSDREGERRGRKAFVSVRRLLEDVQMRDEALMSWIVEMIDAGISGTAADI